MHITAVPEIPRHHRRSTKELTKPQDASNRNQRFIVQTQAKNPPASSCSLKKTRVKRQEFFKVERTLADLAKLLLNLQLDLGPFPHEALPVPTLVVRGPATNAIPVPLPVEFCVDVSHSPTHVECSYFGKRAWYVDEVKDPFHDGKVHHGMVSSSKEVRWGQVDR